MVYATEGVLFLKNKASDHVDDNPHDAGGVRFLFPVLGEGLGLRVPRTLQALKFSDHVLTCFTAGSPRPKWLATPLGL